MQEDLQNSSTTIIKPDLPQHMVSDFIDICFMFFCSAFGTILNILVLYNLVKQYKKQLKSRQVSFFLSREKSLFTGWPNLGAAFVFVITFLFFDQLKKFFLFDSQVFKDFFGIKYDTTNLLTNNKKKQKQKNNKKALIPKIQFYTLPLNFNTALKMTFVRADGPIDHFLWELVENLLYSGLEIVEVGRLGAIDLALDPAPQKEVARCQVRRIRRPREWRDQVS